MYNCVCLRIIKGCVSFHTKRETKNVVKPWQPIWTEFMFFYSNSALTSILLNHSLHFLPKIRKFFGNFLAFKKIMTDLNSHVKKYTKKKNNVQSAQYQLSKNNFICLLLSHRSICACVKPRLNCFCSKNWKQSLLFGLSDRGYLKLINGIHNLNDNFNYITYNILS